jgi:hypothetical protein
MPTSEPKKIFQECIINVDGISFDTWDGIFNDVEEYFATWPWMNDFWIKNG